jgi:hypothetical protein
MDNQFKAYISGAFDELFPVACPDLRALRGGSEAALRLRKVTAHVCLRAGGSAFAMNI